MPPPSVVIVGGGFSGALTAQLLEREFEVTLIDTKNYFEFTPSVLRALAEPEKLSVIQKPHVHYLQHANFVRQSVTHLHPTVIELSNGDRIPYDYLLICTGASYFMPGQPRANVDIEWQSGNHGRNDKDDCLMISTRIPSLAQYHERVMCSRHCIIIGAGTVGVELAAELAETFPRLNITLVGPLLPRSPAKISEHCHAWLTRNRVRLMPRSKITHRDGRKFYTSANEELVADIAFLCTGNVPNSELLRRSGGSFVEAVSERGQARATSTLQLDGFSNIFVAGDVMFLPGEEEKLCQNAIDEAMIVAGNIHRLHNNKPLVHYKPNSKPMLISLGKHDCVLSYRSISLTGFIPSVMKEFVENFEMSKFTALSWYTRFFVRRRPYLSDPHVV